jgi:hypothetical protein
MILQHPGKGSQLLRRGLTVVLALTTICAAGAFAAGPVDPVCRGGNVCVYNAEDNILYQNGANVSGRSIAGGYKIWNNGNRQPGFDHVTVVGVAFGTRYRMCLHYGDPITFNTTDPTAAYINGLVITGWTWRGECAPDEDQAWVPF